MGPPSGKLNLRIRWDDGTPTGRRLNCVGSDRYQDCFPLLNSRSQHFLRLNPARRLLTPAVPIQFITEPPPKISNISNNLSGIRRQWRRLARVRRQGMLDRHVINEQVLISTFHLLYSSLASTCTGATAVSFALSNYSLYPPQYLLAHFPPMHEFRSALPRSDGHRKQFQIHIELLGQSPCTTLTSLQIRCAAKLLRVGRVHLIPGITNLGEVLATCVKPQLGRQHLLWILERSE
jgi:hypothetical protein